MWSLKSMKLFCFIFFAVILLNNFNLSDTKSRELDLSSFLKITAFIEEMVFVIKEHSGYAMAHPDNLDNVVRHLEHSCHAIHPDLVKKRPMPAPEIGLKKVLEVYFNKTGIVKEEPYIELLKITENAITMCKLALSSSSIEKLNKLAKYINVHYTRFHKLF